MRRAITVIALAGWTFAAAPAAAQRADSLKALIPGAFVGFVKNAADSSPVRSADIRLYYIDSARAIREPGGGSAVETFIDTVRSRLGVSGENGYFAVWHLAAGRYVMSVRRIGFEPTEAIVAVDTGTVSFDFTMMPISSILAKVEITDTVTTDANRRLDRAGFSRRYHGGQGQFIRREEFLKHAPETLRDILDRYGLRQSADYLFDRMPLSYDDITEYPADLIAGIELYRHNRPMEFGGTMSGANLMSAGGLARLMRPLVVIWTYSP